MKANRKFVETDEAVSPVIAVILMVAITVVLAATVFVLVSDIGSQTGKTAPAFSLTQDETLDRLSISSAASGADWNRLELTSDPANVRCNTNGQAIAVPVAPNAACVVATAGTFVDITTATDPMTAGEFLDLCVTPAATTTFKITLRDVNANQIMGEWTFLSLLTC